MALRKSASTRTAAVETPDQATSLAQIREKELEFDGLVIVARSEAEKTISQAEARAQAQLKQAEAEAERLMAESEQRADEAARAEVDSAHEATRRQISEMRDVAEARKRALVDEIVQATLGSS